MAHLPDRRANVRLTRRAKSLSRDKIFFETTYQHMNQQAAASQKSRAEQETENEANRLREQVDSALSIVAQRSPDEFDALQTAADRIERAARDLADVLRELAQQRRATDES
jgi:hypothetical protein